jgi:DNA-binding PadR family transcriptional regulator
LYGAITRLEERGLIRPVGARDRRQPYRLTAAGKQHLEQELEDMQSVVRVGLGRLRQA